MKKTQSLSSENINKEKVNIRPGISILSVLKHIEYEPWYALAEFVDNSIGSYLKNQKQIKEIDGKKSQLIITIELNDTDKKIVIKDNAGGIHKEDYARAFRAAEIPLDNTGLSEFGMGMKSAACWFSDNWSVRSTAIGENVEKTVVFNLNDIFFDKLEELNVKTKKQDLNSHYTIIELSEISKMPIKKTRSKIKEHLASIYREFIRNGTLKIIINGEALEYTEPKILTAPFPYDSDKDPIFWKKEIDIEIEKGMKVKGFVAIRETMSNTESGFALFRRGRVIEGSADQGFKPKEIMGELGSPENKRIFGELHLHGFKVSFTKRSIKWDETMELVLEAIKAELIHPTFPLLKQAKEYRVNPTKAEIKNAAESAIKETVDKFKNNITPTINEIQKNGVPNKDPIELEETENSSYREFEINLNDSKWLITIELSYDSSIIDWLEVGSHVIKGNLKETSTRQVGVRMSLNHPFVKNYAGTDKTKLEPILRIAAAIGLAEEAARAAGISRAGTVRMNLNKLLMAISK